jgi:hypothetical protein
MIDMIRITAKTKLGTRITLYRCDLDEAERTAVLLFQCGFKNVMAYTN